MTLRLGQRILQMRIAGKPLTNIYEPPTRGFRLYDFGNGRFQACRSIKKDTVTRTFFTLEDCYKFLEKHKDAIIPDEIDMSLLPH